MSRAEKRAANRIVQSAATGHDRLKQCAAEALARAGELRAALTDPVKINAAVPEWRAEQQRIEREHLVQQNIEQAAVRAAEERERAQREAEEERARAAEAKNRAQREAEEERARALRRDLGATLDRIAATSRAVIDARETARAELAQVEKDVVILQRRYGSALRAPEYREPVATLVEGVLALREAGAALEREAQMAASSAELTRRVQVMKASGPNSLLDRANLDTLARGAEAARAEHEQAIKTLADRRGSLVRTVERTTQLSASLQ